MTGTPQKEPTSPVSPSNKTAASPEAPKSPAPQSKTASAPASPIPAPASEKATKSPEPETSPEEPTTATAVAPTSPPAETTPAPAPAPTGDAPSSTAEFLPTSHWFTTEVPAYDEDDEDSNDSALGLDAASSTASLTESVLAYRTINGRRYHSERGNAQYWASNDDAANDSMDMVHTALTVCIDDKLFLAPLKDNIQKVLDVGTGTGMWAMDFADAYPGCEVIGTDISPIQTTWVPPNLKFEIEDCTQDWTFEPNMFDFIHMRHLYGSIDDWFALMERAYRTCKPGGWVQSYETSTEIKSDDGTGKPGKAITEWGKFFIEGGKRLGRTFEILQTDLQERAMAKAGFVDIQVHNVKMPFGMWPADPKLKMVGQCALHAMSLDYEGYVSFMANLLHGWGRNEVLVYCAHMRYEMTRFKPWCWSRVVWGRKPE